MFPQFGATGDTLSKASTIMFRIGTDAHLYDDPEDVNIAPLLDSKFDSEKCEALKRLLALIAQGFDVSNFFPQVVKNVASHSMEVKKLVYLYLLHYAQKRPNEALLSINSFQRDLGDTNPLVRAWALRTMAGIRLHAIAPLVLVAVGKCARDPSVYVRKCAANALSKLHDLRLEEHSDTIEEIVGTLLTDHSPAVVGAAAAAFSSVCPNSHYLIGKNYKRLCTILPDVEEWGQIVLIGILLRYAIARHGLVKESIMFHLQNKEQSSSQNDDSAVDSTFEEKSSDISKEYDSELASMISRCYIEGPDDYLSRSSYSNRMFLEFSSAKFTSSKNVDVEILLQCTSPLFWSNNSAVVLAAAGVHWIMAPRDGIQRIVKPLLFLLRSSSSSNYVVLCNIQVFAKAMPALFAPHFENFFILSSDSYQTKALKLEILSIIATDSSVSSILKEFQDYIRDPDRRFAADTVAAIGLCALQLPKTASKCLEGLLALTRHDLFTSDIKTSDEEAGVLVQAIMSIKMIIKQDPPSHEKVIVQLIRNLDSIRVPEARAIIIWMLGEYSLLGDLIPKMLIIVLKYLARNFTSESSETKLQTLNTVAKVLPKTKEGDLETLSKLGRYVLELAESDMNYVVRGRGRFFRKLLSCHFGSEKLEDEASSSSGNEGMLNLLAEHMFREQTTQLSPVPINFRVYLPGSLSQIVLHAAPGYEPLPKPCTILPEELNQLSDADSGANVLDPDASGSLSESLDEESSSYDGSEHSNSSSGNADTGNTGSSSEDEKIENPLIQISDENQTGLVPATSADLGELMSSRDLDTWLDDQPDIPNSSTSEGTKVSRSARISIKDIGRRVTPKTYELLDPTNGNGLKVVYKFSSDISSVSPYLVTIQASFENCSSETISNIALKHEESTKSSDDSESSSPSEDNVPVLVPMEEITSLEPGEATTATIHVHFHHHLLPLKLVLHFNGKKHPVKLRPDIGYFVKPLPMEAAAFKDKESHLRGMFECTRSCIFSGHVENLNKDKGNTFGEDNFLVVCESLASTMLSNANLFLVSVDMPIAAKHDDATGLCLRFSSEILSNSMPCLITVTSEGICSEPLNVSVKVNCEETVFGLNLLNRIVNFLS
ncbi:AP3-complex subunit beta-A [Linum grandiflorum]